MKSVANFDITFNGMNNTKKTQNLCVLVYLYLPYYCLHRSTFFMFRWPCYICDVIFSRCGVWSHSGLHECGGAVCECPPADRRWKGNESQL